VSVVVKISFVWRRPQTFWQTYARTRADPKGPGQHTLPRRIFKSNKRGKGRTGTGPTLLPRRPDTPLKKNTAVNLLYRKRGRSFAFEQCLPQQADEVGIGRRRKVTQHFRLGQVAGHVAVYRREEWAPLGVLLGDRFSELFLVDALNCATSKIKKRKWILCWRKSCFSPHLLSIK